MSIPTRRVSSPFMIGAFVLVGLATLVVLTLWLGAAKFFQEYKEFNTYFDTSVQGLEAGQPVKYQGVPVGNIQRLRLAADGKLIEVAVRINKNVAIDDSMRLRIEMASIAGSRYLLLFYPADPALLRIHPALPFTPDHPVIPSAPSSIEELRVSLNEALNNVLAIDTRGISAESVRALRSIAQAMENPEIAEILHNVNLSAKGVGWLVGAFDTSHIVGKAGNVMNDAEATSKNLVLMSETLLRTAEQLEKVTNRVDKEIDQIQIAKQTEKVISRYDTTMLGIQHSVTSLTRRADNSVSNLAILIQELKATNRDLRKSLRMVNDNPSQLLFAEPPPKEKSMHNTFPLTMTMNTAIYHSTRQNFVNSLKADFGSTDILVCDPSDTASNLTDKNVCATKKRFLSRPKVIYTFPISKALQRLLLSAVFLLPLVGVTACISLKTEYPKTSYYRLEDKPIQKAAKTAPEGLLVKPFTIDSEFDTDRMIVMASGTEAQPLHYHRWTSEPQELITAHITNRLQQSGFFAEGVFTPASSVVPGLQLEGRIMECLARGTAQEGNIVSLRIHCTVQRLDSIGRTSVLLQKVYTQTVRRTSDAAASIAPAMSEAVSAVGDVLLADLSTLLIKP